MAVLRSLLCERKKSNGNKGKEKKTIQYSSYSFIICAASDIVIGWSYFVLAVSIVEVVSLRDGITAIRSLLRGAWRGGGAAVSHICRQVGGVLTRDIHVST